MVLGSFNHWLQWFSMVMDHWSNDAMVSMYCSPLLLLQNSIVVLSCFHPKLTVQTISALYSCPPCCPSPPWRQLQGRDFSLSTNHSTGEYRNIPKTFGFLALSCKFVSMTLEDWHLRREWRRFPFALDTFALVSFKTSSGQTSMKVGFFPFTSSSSGTFFSKHLALKGASDGNDWLIWSCKVDMLTSLLRKVGMVWVVAGVHNSNESDTTFFSVFFAASFWAG